MGSHYWQEWYVHCRREQRDIGVIEPHQKRMIRRIREARFRIRRGRENTGFVS